jgi:DNA-binding MarR family transcriptional regulator
VDADELRAEIGASTLRFIANVVLHNQAVAQRLGLGGSDSQFLSLLQLHGPLTPGKLAELTGLTTGTVTGVIDRLERAGYVRRERDAGDRRKVLVTQVPEAMATLAQHYREHGAHLDTVLRRRDVAQLQVIADFLAEVNGSAPRAPSAEPSGSSGSRSARAPGNSGS